MKCRIELICRSSMKNEMKLPMKVIQWLSSSLIYKSIFCQLDIFWNFRAFIYQTGCANGVAKAMLCTADHRRRPIVLCLLLCRSGIFYG
jgi:hypothetical protein